MNPPKYFSAVVTGVFAIIVLLPIIYMAVSPLLMEVGGIGDQGALFDGRHIALAKNSLGLATGATVLSVLIGVPLAFLIARTDMWGSRIFKTMFIIPVLIPPYIHAIVWSRMNDFVKDFFSLDIHSIGGAILVLSLSYFPFVTLLVLSGLKSLDRNMEEVSLLANGRWKTMSKITIPLVTPHVLSGAIFVFIFSIIDFSVPDILRVNVYPVEIFIQFSAFYNERAAMLYSLPLIAVTVVLLLLQRRYMKNRSYVQISGGFSPQTSYKLGRMNIGAFAICITIFSLSVFIPLIVLLKTAGSWSNYVRVFLSSKEQIIFSLILAFSGALITVLLAFFISSVTERTKNRLSVPLDLLSFIPLAVPATCLGIGLIKVWNRPFADIIYASPVIIIIGYIARFIPFMIMSVTSGLKQVGKRVEEAAFLNVDNWWRVTRKIVMPLTGHCLIAGFFIVFILSFGELGTTLLVIPPGIETVPIKIYNLMHYGADQMVAALCLIMLAIILIASGLFLVIYKKLMKRLAYASD